MLEAAMPAAASKNAAVRLCASAALRAPGEALWPALQALDGRLSWEPIDEQEELVPPGREHPRCALIEHPQYDCPDRS